MTASDLTKNIIFVNPGCLFSNQTGNGWVIYFLRWEKINIRKRILGTVNTDLLNFQ